MSKQLINADFDIHRMNLTAIIVNRAIDGHSNVIHPGILLVKIEFPTSETLSFQVEGYSWFHYLNERRQGHNHEERQAGDARGLPSMWHQDVQNR